MRNRLRDIAGERSGAADAAPRAGAVVGTQVAKASRVVLAEGSDTSRGAASADPGASADSPLVLRGLTVAYADMPAVVDVDATFPSGAMTAIIGPNGAGKSTLLRAALGLVPALAGQVRAFGQPLAHARDRIAYVPQRASVDWDFPARAMDVVLMGLYRQLGLLGRVRPRHRDLARDCLDRVGMAGLADRQIGQLSGGQQQRVFLARALAQEADLYLLDEPFAGVDAATETAIIGVLQGLRDAGKAVVAVHHDLATVPAYFDRVLLMNVRIIAEGPVAQAFTPQNLQLAYGGRLAGMAFGTGAAAARDGAREDAPDGARNDAGDPAAAPDATPG